jgi:hypothetical protein
MDKVQDVSVSWPVAAECPFVQCGHEISPNVLGLALWVSTPLCYQLLPGKPSPTAKT